MVIFFKIGSRLQYDHQSCKKILNISFSGYRKCGPFKKIYLRRKLKIVLLSNFVTVLIPVYLCKTSEVPIKIHWFISKRNDYSTCPCGKTKWNPHFLRDTVRITQYGLNFTGLGVMTSWVTSSNIGRLFQTTSLLGLHWKLL